MSISLKYISFCSSKTVFGFIESFVNGFGITSCSCLHDIIMIWPNLFYFYFDNLPFLLDSDFFLSSTSVIFRLILKSTHNDFGFVLNCFCYSIVIFLWFHFILFWSQAGLIFQIFPQPGFVPIFHSICVHYALF